MRVIHLTDGLTADGAEIAAERLHVGLKKAGIDSKVLCLVNPADAPDTIKFHRSASRIERKLNSTLGRLSRPVGLNQFIDLTSFKINGQVRSLEADVLIIHGYYSFSPFAIPQFTRTRPALLVLHDMWSFTGHCSHSLDCQRWETGCGNCPYLNIPPATPRDCTRLGWKLKNWAYSHSKLAVISPSLWMADLAKKSMLKRFPVYQIPHGIETETYQRREPEQCRRLLGIPLGKKVLLFAAPRLTNYLKGGDLLLKALQQLPKSLKADALVLLLGHNGEAIAHSAGMESINLGYVSNDHLKAICYSAADLLVHSSRAESLSYVTLESMACGTPVVAFKVGGIPDLVRQGTTGYLAQPGNAKDLCDGIVQLLNDEALRRCMSRQGREIAVREFSIDLQVQRYIDLINKGSAANGSFQNH